MANNDWDLDDLLDFQFDREVPEKSKKVDIDNDRKLYEELRRESKSSSAPAFDVPEPLSGHKWIDDDNDIFAQYDREHAFSRVSDNAPSRHRRKPTTDTEATTQKIRKKAKKASRKGQTASTRS